MPEDEDPKRPCQLWVTDFHGLAPIYSTRSLIRSLGWFPSDGSFLLAEVDNNRAFPADVTLVRLSGDGKVRRVIGHIPHAYFANIHLSPDRRSVAVESSYKDTDDIWVLPAEGGTPRMVTGNKESRTYYCGLAWSPDSKSIYCAKQSTYDSFIIYKDFR